MNMPATRRREEDPAGGLGGSGKELKEGRGLAAMPHPLPPFILVRLASRQGTLLGRSGE